MVLTETINKITEELDIMEASSIQKVSTPKDKQGLESIETATKDEVNEHLKSLPKKTYFYAVPTWLKQNVQML